MKPNLYFGLNLDKRANRRRTVLLMYVGFILIMATSAVVPTHRNPNLLIHALQFAAFLLPVVLSILTYFALCNSMKAYCFDEYGKELPETDERQAHIRDRSFVASYWILASIVSFGLIYFLIAPDWNLPHATDFFTSPGFNIFALLFIASLPTVCVAWNEPGLEDEPRDLVTSESKTEKSSR